jgi:hypothetical protein
LGKPSGGLRAYLTLGDAGLRWSALVHLFCFSSGPLLAAAFIILIRSLRPSYHWCRRLEQGSPNLDSCQSYPVVDRGLPESHKRQSPIGRPRSVFMDTAFSECVHPIGRLAYNHISSDYGFFGSVADPMGDTGGDGVIENYGRRGLKSNEAIIQMSVIHDATANTREAQAKIFGSSVPKCREPVPLRYSAMGWWAIAS